MNLLILNYWIAPIQIEIAESGATNGLLHLIQPGKEDDRSITMAAKVIDNMVAEGKQVYMYWFESVHLTMPWLDTARKVFATPSSVRAYITMIEHLYKSEVYLDELDLLENLADTLLQIIMDDGNRD